MVVITLGQLTQCHASPERWRAIKQSKKYIRQDESFPLTDLIEICGVYDTIWALRCAEDTSLSLRFVLKCAKHNAAGPMDERSKKAMFIVRQFLKGKATDKDLADAEYIAESAARQAEVKAHTAWLVQSPRQGLTEKFNTVAWAIYDTVRSARMMYTCTDRENSVDSVNDIGVAMAMNNLPEEDVKAILYDLCG